jgi:hypothetical protein
MASKAIVLRGVPVQNEDGAAGESDIKPGMLVSGVTTIVKHATAGGATARNFALERDELGKDIDVAYALGDIVKVGSFAPGMRVNALIASGANITADTYMESAGNGRLRAFTSGTRIGRAVESVNATGPGDARLKVEVY